MNILLTGASGFIGHHVLTVLEQQSHQITLCCHHSKPLFFNTEHNTVLSINFSEMTQPEDWQEHLKEIDVVINCVGIIAETSQQSFDALHSHAPIALFKAAEKRGVKKVIQISALGADDSAKSHYHLSKKAADDVLKNLAIDSYIIQPSIVYGDGAQSMALFHALAMLPVHALIDGGEQLMQPVHIDDITATINQCLDNKSQGHRVLALVGAEAISYKQLLAQLRYRLGKKPAYTFSLPGQLAEKSAFIGQYLGEATFNAENIAMLRRGNSADTKPIQQFLGRTPHSIQDKLLLTPANQAERWHAGLYFLRPLLRLSIAFLWLWSGIVSIFFYPPELSYQLLAASSITGIYATAMLYGLAVLDIILGLATLLVYRIRPLIFAQLILITLYTLAITLTLAEFWFHPFGPVLKNLPLLITLLVYLNLEGEKP